MGRVDIDHLLTTAEAAVRSGDEAGAKAALSAVLASDPAHAVAAIRLGRLRLAAGDIGAARDLAERARASEPENPWAATLAAQAAEATGDAEAARASWEAVSRFRPGPGAAAFDRAPAADIRRRAGLKRPKRRRETPADLAAFVGTAGTGDVLGLMDGLLRIVDLEALERLHRALPDGPLRDYLDFRLWFRSQVYAPPLALAERLLAAPELAGRRAEIAGMAARAALMLEDAAAVARWLPPEDPTDLDEAQRLLNAVWRGDPERGLRLAERLAFSGAASSNAETLHVFLPLLRDDPEMARDHLRLHLARHTALKRAPSPELMLAAASVWWTTGPWGDYRRALAAYFRAFGLESPIPEGDNPVRFPDLAAPVEPYADGPLVTVILTVFNAASTIDYALGSLLAQSHTNLEIIAVDDRSTDDTLARLRAVAARDPRVRVVVNAQNLGTYVSKTRALAEATGAYWVCHDGDDWAHPRRIERHVAAMEAYPELVATRSNWIRMDADGMPFIRRTSGTWTHINPGSPFYRRAEVMAAVGGYDRVRIDGDLDHWRRTLAHFGPERLAQLRQPLTVGLLHPGSLTRSGAGAQNDEHYSAVRSAYRHEGLQWRRRRLAEGLSLRVDETSGRPFPAPPEMLA